MQKSFELTYYEAAMLSVHPPFATPLNSHFKRLNQVFFFKWVPNINTYVKSMTGPVGDLRKTFSFKKTLAE